MKKINKIKTALFLPLIMLFSSCFDPIFYEIRKDVEPETATVSGQIGQITRFTMNGEEYLFLSADGGLRYKKADNQSHGSWQTMALPFSLQSFSFDDTAMSGKQLIGVFANEDTLYLFAASYNTTGSEGTTNPSKIDLYGSKTPDNVDSWVLINENSETNYFPLYKAYDDDDVDEVWKSNFNVFQTNAPQAAHRHVYIRSGSRKYYELKGTLEPQEITISTAEDGNADSIIHSAAYFNGAVRFFNSKVVTTDETYDTEAEHIYYEDGKVLMYASKANYEDDFIRTCSCDYQISALAVTKDSIIIGLGDLTGENDNGGITRVLLTDGIPAGSTSHFTTNAAFQITSVYKVLTLLNATPGETEEKSSLYSSITFSSYSGLYENIGLWSYYPNRGNWNRE